MAQTYKKLRKTMSPEARKKSTKKAKKLVMEVEALQELREARECTQAELAKKLNTSQANVSKIERRTDIYLSTLRTYIEGVGGELEICAKFPDGSTVRVNQFHELENDPK